MRLTCPSRCWRCRYQFLPSICAFIGTSGTTMMPRSDGFGTRSLSSSAPDGPHVAKVLAPLELDCPSSRRNLLRCMSLDLALLGPSARALNWSALGGKADVLRLDR